MRRTLSTLLGAALTGAGALALACGGPESYDLAVLKPASSYVGALTTINDGLDVDTIPQLRFLYPAKQAGLPAADAAFAYAYEGNSPGPLPEEKELQAALAAGRLDAAAHQAQALVARVLDEPAGVADAHQAAFRSALELLDVRALLKPEEVRAFAAGQAPAGPLAEAVAVRTLPRAQAGAYLAAHPQTPRAASLRFVALQESMVAKIPDGWSEGKPTLSESDAAELRAGIDAWLRDFPRHPLADLVRLLRVRIAYFRADGPGAWKAALEVYPRHPARALAEMRYLLRRELQPPESVVAAADPVLLTGLINDQTPLDEKGWARAWQVSESPAGKAVSVNLQERLLANAARLVGPGKPLPAGFPAAAAAPTPLWAALRTAALLQAGRLDDALAQAQKLDTARDATQASLVAGVRLARGEGVEAALVPGLEEHLRSYLIRIQLDDAALAALAPRAPAALREEVALTRAQRKVEAGDWQGGAALLDPADPRAPLWKQAGALAAGLTPTPGKLAYARFLREHAAGLLFDDSSGLSRSLKDRLPAPGQPASAEQERLRRYLFEGNAQYLALAAYAAYLSDPAATGKSAKAALGEADKLYNHLLNWDYAWSAAYKAALKEAPASVAIREAGKRLRGGK